MDDIGLPTLADLGLVPFLPRAPWWGGDLQTIRNYVLRDRSTHARKSERLVLPLSDGSGDQLAAALDLPEKKLPCAPLVILIHGLTGSERSAYMARSAMRLAGLGYPALRLNLRGAGPSRPLSRYQYHAGRTEDLDRVLAALPSNLVANGVVAIGFSLGGNMLLKFLGERGRAQPLRAAVSISAPIDLAGTARRMQRWRNFAYLSHLMRELRREALAASSELTSRERGAIRAATSLYEFDQNFTAPRNGFAGAEDYYARNGALRFLDGIKVPTLVIHALDDPWVPADPYAAYDWTRNRSLAPVLPAQGGHIGFHGADWPACWHDVTIERFFAAIFSPP